MDSFIGRMLATIGSISRLFDAETVLVGMRPAVAITLTELGLSLKGVRTALNAEKKACACSQPAMDGTADLLGR